MGPVNKAICHNALQFLGIQKVDSSEISLIDCERMVETKLKDVLKSAFCRYTLFILMRFLNTLVENFRMITERLAKSRIRSYREDKFIPYFIFSIEVWIS